MERTFILDGSKANTLISRLLNDYNTSTRSGGHCPTRFWEIVTAIEKGDCSVECFCPYNIGYEEHRPIECYYGTITCKQCWSRKAANTKDGKKYVFAKGG